MSFCVKGKNAYNLFKYESGGHRFIRTPPTEKRGRTHTSVITVAVLKIPEETEFKLNLKEVEFRFIRAFGKGGQHQQKTESGVIARHLPSGIEAKSTSDRSQHTNKELALECLKSRIFESIQKNSLNNINSIRSQCIGTGHRSDKIRTIKFTDNIVKCEITQQTKDLKSYLKGDILFKN